MIDFSYGKNFNVPTSCSSLSSTVYVKNVFVISPLNSSVFSCFIDITFVFSLSKAIKR